MNHPILALKDILSYSNLVPDAQLAGRRAAHTKRVAKRAAKVAKAAKDLGEFSSGISTGG